MNEPGFWDDPDAAGKANAEHARLSRKVEGLRKLRSDADDLEALIEMAAEDPELADEVEQSIVSAE